MMDSDLPSCNHGSHEIHPRLPLPADANVENAVVMLRAAGDTARLRLLLLLVQGERCVTELAGQEGEKIATISARLKHLHSARLVKRRRVAKHVYYALADHHVVHFLRDILDHASENNSSPQKNEGEIL
ncbi:helix-turn-helix transcriptional regulator [Roseibium sp. RKSG952]|uniref:ArsR/SmtB family transcription factor n=1 Tax=Roseibium sp. RKSG952 TaxID=2529384 RepID=UPI001FCB260F|nr:helix-turn-helix domain-containing protein [Roseibium sp. RKSG952]